ncbi:MAG: PqqD family protein [Gemmatimonadota bacterium]
MTASAQQFRLNAPLAVSEMIDGEAVIMNMDSGHYFSARGLAGVLWEWTITGCAVDAMANTLASAFPGEPVHQDIGDFIQSLQSHALVVPMPSTLASATPDAAELATVGAYQRPVIDVFTDMQDLLLLDPIHDVGEAGWPMPLPATVQESV